MKPDKVNIHGVIYTIEYFNKPSEVDIFKRDSLWGQIDYWTRTIRVYDNNRNTQDIWKTIMHEILHGIASDLNLKDLDKNEDTIDMLARSLVDTLFRNDWLNFGEKNDHIS
ncbi:hypothetical protein LCGC14_2453570 [marine sediment metagenome]|uniref:IrrE N-terminal-like domain-containing protein n=1 Tax=marine sediment metagenome TaxID=412755 RepID=A0A0F9E984_9ZZZZ